ncbi:Arm DNA-binding domain-containing protein [Vreelandella aquamarina]|uniref:Arm DNA-binding domain-containing protein n=1 Tax=Vreelandella aquamarina TaxID=77097 RepID=UPI003CC90E76
MIPKAGAAYWMCRYTFAGKRRGMSLGKYSHLSLAEAREQWLRLRRRFVAVKTLLPSANVKKK